MKSKTSRSQVRSLIELCPFEYDRHRLALHFVTGPEAKFSRVKDDTTRRASGHARNTQVRPLTLLAVEKLCRPSTLKRDTVDSPIPWQPPPAW